MNWSRAIVSSLVGSCLATLTCAQSPPGLRPLSNFDSIGNELDCHPANRQPTQGDDLHPRRSRSGQSRPIIIVLRRVRSVA